MKAQPAKGIAAMLSLLAFSANGFSHEKLSDGIAFSFDRAKPGETRLLRVQVCGENILRVTASPVGKFSRRQSLMVERTDWKSVPWSVRRQGGKAVLSTAAVQAAVDTVYGTVEFLDPDGRVVLGEKPGGRTFTSAEAFGEPVWRIRQCFDSPEDEAFYGLGQHQNGVMNAKGQDVDLWQHNIAVAVPFLVSSRGYGILWDNNSRTRFGDPRDWQPISSLALYGRDGTRGGLTAEYFQNRDFTSPIAARSEPEILHSTIDVNDAFPAGFDPNNGSVRWDGEIEAAETGVHKFKLYASSYFKIWLDGRLVADGWRQNWLPWTRFARLPLEAGKRFPVRIEWIPNGGFIGLEWLGPEPGDPSRTLSLCSDVADEVDYYFILGKNADGVISGYRTLTGKAPVMPKWAMGLWQCRERYRSSDELVGTVREFRNRKIPLDNIVQDWFYWKEDQWGSHEFDPSRFPDPDGMVRTLHDDLNAHVMISVWPKFYAGTGHFKEFEENGWLYRRNVEVGQRDWVGPGYVSTFYDPYSRGARDLFWKQVDEHLFSKGFDAWWMDATEPDICSNLSTRERLLRMHPTALGSAARYENTYSLMQAKAVYEGQRRSDPDRRVFILTRSAFAGQQRYSAATWSGDVAARWHDLAAQVPAGLDFCLSGIPYWTTDIGGFAVEQRFENAKGADLDEWRELMTRWFQFGAFCPLFRVHGQFPYREMFNVAPPDHPAFRSMLAYDRLRYRLMPYLYSMAGWVHFNDYTIMRGLVMDFGNDPAVLSIDDQYMFGPALLVNPVTEYKARKRPVVLPAGCGWIDLKSGAFHAGGQTLSMNAPYGEIPVFVREGSIVPTGPELLYADEKPADPIRLWVFTGRDASFTLYEDKGTDNGYERGACSTIEFSYNEAEGALTIGGRKGEFPGMLKDRTFEVVRAGKDRKRGMDFNSKPDRALKYSGTKIVVQIR
jgi:alpha-D-xyloside xylohydrolase